MCQKIFGLNIIVLFRLANSFLFWTLKSNAIHALLYRLEWMLCQINFLKLYIGLIRYLK